MKKFRKLSSVLMALFLLLTMATPAGSVGIDLDDTIHTGGMNDLNVRQAARDYMDTRAAYLLGETETMEWIIEGRADNEAEHKTHLEERNIVLTGLSYEIILVECGGTESLVTIEESVNYIKDGLMCSEIVLHELCVLCSGVTPYVTSDGYYEVFSNFRSHAYVSPQEQGYFPNSAAAGSQLCIINVAFSQLGKGEDETGATIYGARQGKPKVDWCSAFICWCAAQANIHTSLYSSPVIYDNADCDACMNYYLGKNQFYWSSNYGGGYTPQPGDIMFKGGPKIDEETKKPIIDEETGEVVLDATHVGLVVSVSETSFYIIDGNGPRNVVEHKSRQMADESILGYAHPSYENTNHTYSKYYNAGEVHELGCINCGCRMHPSSSAPHFYSENYDEVSHWEECIDCGYKKNEAAHTCSGYLKNLSNHWRECAACGIVYATEEHTFVVWPNGTRRCSVCNYVAPGIGDITPVPGLSIVDIIRKE